MSEEYLKSYLIKNNVSFKIHEFKEHTMTVEAAEKQLGVERSKIIKSMLFTDDLGNPILAIVTGDRKVDEEKLAKAIGVKKVWKAKLRMVKEITGYEAGALPPVGHKKPIKTIIDPKVLENNVVFGGGGRVNKLLEIDPKDIVKLTNAEVVRIST